MYWRKEEVRGRDRLARGDRDMPRGKRQRKGRSRYGLTVSVWLSAAVTCGPASAVFQVLLLL